MNKNRKKIQYPYETNTVHIKQEKKKKHPMKKIVQCNKRQKWKRSWWMQMIFSVDGKIFKEAVVPKINKAANVSRSNEGSESKDIANRKS